MQRLNGFQTLWFARSRESADDYSRMARQKCVMNAMLQQLSPADRGHEVREDRQGQRAAGHHRPARPRELGTFAELAMKARSQPIGTVSFVPPTINTGHPDIDKIQSMVTAAIDRSEAPGRAQAAGAPKQPRRQEGLLARPADHRGRLDRQPARTATPPNASERPVELPAEPTRGRAARARVGCAPVTCRRVVAVVVTWNRRDLLVESLAALRAQTLPPAAIVVVDNASTDGTAELLAAEPRRPRRRPPDRATPAARAGSRPASSGR